MQSDELEINYNLPYARVFSNEDAQNLDAARVGATVTPEGELSADEATPSFGADGLMPV